MNQRTKHFISDAFCSVTRTFPNIRKFLWKELYQGLAGLYVNSEWTFMNYGYASLDPGDRVPALAPEDETNRSFIQLYHKALHRSDMKNADVLEVGCGRGGGSAYMARYLGARSVCGMDLSPRAVRFCRRTHSHPALKFKVGDSEALPFRNGSFDAVMNVESSHCYPSLDRFFSEVRRVLRPGGSFHITDLRDDVGVEPFHAALRRSGMEIEAGGDITKNVIAALRSDGRRRLDLFRKTLLSPLLRYFQEFAGNEESSIFRKFAEKRIFYFSYLLRRA